MIELENEVFLNRPFGIFFWLHLNENKQPVHMRYHLFLHYGWFHQNLGKDFIRTNMHTTVCCRGIAHKGIAMAVVEFLGQGSLIHKINALFVLHIFDNFHS